MKHIETKLTEKQFLRRLEELCKEKTRFDKGYTDKNVFIFKRNKSKFWLCKHYADVGRTDGYGNDCIYFQYKLSEKGHVIVEYTFGKLIMLLIPFILIFAVGIALWSVLIYEAIVFFNVQWGGLCITTIFWVFGLFGLLFRSPKERQLLEKHLIQICNIEP